MQNNLFFKGHMEYPDYDSFPCLTIVDISHHNACKNQGNTLTCYTI